MKKAIASIAVSLALAPVASADPFAVKLDQTVTVTLASAPGSIIVGNPAIAGVRLRDGKLLITGKSSGDTSIVVLDETGHKIWQTSVAVRSSDHRVVKLRPA